MEYPAFYFQRALVVSASLLISSRTTRTIALRAPYFSFSLYHSTTHYKLFHRATFILYPRRPIHHHFLSEKFIVAPKSTGSETVDRSAAYRCFPPSCRLDSRTPCQLPCRRVRRVRHCTVCTVRLLSWRAIPMRKTDRVCLWWRWRLELELELEPPVWLCI
jgi:hypothetical protein